MEIPRQSSLLAPTDSGAGTVAGNGTLQFITFTLGVEEYGIDIMVVREIKAWTETTAIPRAPAHVRGVVNLRGLIVPIFDLRARFGMGITTPTPTHAVIIVNPGTRTVGLLVDTVSDIIAVEPGAIRPVPEMGLSLDDRFLAGMVALGERMVTLVSLDGLFSADVVQPAEPDLVVIPAPQEVGSDAPRSAAA